MSAAVVERMFAILASGRATDLREILADDCIDRNPVPGQPPGWAGVALKMALWLAEKPQARSEALQIREEGAQVFARWRTWPAPGEPALTLEGRFGIREGRIIRMEVETIA